MIGNVKETKANDGSGYWRWNVNPTWENFSSLCQESDTALEAKNKFLRYHHLKAALYFGVGSIESFLNEAMRKKLAKEGIEEEKIHRKLKRTQFGEKLEKWPGELSNPSFFTQNNLADLILVYRELRNEITHPKRRDHSIYRDLDGLDIGELVVLVAEFIVGILEKLQEVFPYWLLGWNFVGMGSEKEKPCLINNQQFLHALGALGFNIPPDVDDMAKIWQERNMSSIEGFRRLKEALAKINGCQPASQRFPFAPRLCRRWWEAEHVRKCGLVVLSTGVNDRAKENSGHKGRGNDP